MAGELTVEQLSYVAALRTPGDPAAEPMLRLVGDAHPALPRVLPKAVDPREASGGRGFGRALRKLRIRQRPDHQDLLVVGGHLGRADEPLGRKAPREPPLQLLDRCVP
jgi:hypothetical protein